MADRYQWTPGEVDALDPDFLEELMMRLAAEADHEALRRKQRAQQGRAAGQLGPGWAVEDAEVE